MSGHETAMVPAAVGTVARREFGADQLARSAETATSAMAAQATAEVQARYVVAARQPRHEEDARLKMLGDCKRPGFADIAIYRKPLGGGKFAEGPSIRFAETAARAWRNLHTSIAVAADDAEKRIVRVTVTDLEANISESLDLVIEKVVERKFLKDGQQPIRQRLNSYGDLVYLVPATEADLVTKQAAEVSKAKRQCIVHLIPRDILDECMAQVRRTQTDRDAKDPEAARRALFDAFAATGVRPSDLEIYLGHAVEGASPAELGELRAVYSAIRDGDVTWPEALSTKVPPTEGAAPNLAAEKIKARLQKGRKPAATRAPEHDPITRAPEHDPITGEVGPAPREPGDDSR